MNMNTESESKVTISGHEATGKSPAARWVHGLTVLVASLMVLAAAAAASASPASASTLDGTATVETPGGTPFTPGATTGSATEFTLGLPSGAACSGDTASDGYHVYSYLVSSGTDVDNLTISGGHPSAGYGLFNNSGTYQGPFNTAPSTGVIQTLPINLEWATWVNAHHTLSALENGGTTGVWEAGVLCANSSGVVTDYWNTEVTFAANSGDPNSFVWSAAPGDPNNGANPEVPYALILPILAIAILGGVVLVRRRRQSVPLA